MLALAKSRILRRSKRLRRLQRTLRRPKILTGTSAEPHLLEEHQRSQSKNNLRITRGALLETRKSLIPSLRMALTSPKAALNSKNQSMLAIRVNSPNWAINKKMLHNNKLKPLRAVLLDSSQLLQKVLDSAVKISLKAFKKIKRRKSPSPKLRVLQNLLVL